MVQVQVQYVNLFLYTFSLLNVLLIFQLSHYLTNTCIVTFFSSNSHYLTNINDFYFCGNLLFNDVTKSLIVLQRFEPCVVNNFDFLYYYSQLLYTFGLSYCYNYTVPHIGVQYSAHLLIGLNVTHLLQQCTHSQNYKIIDSYMCWMQPLVNNQLIDLLTTISNYLPYTTFVTFLNMCKFTNHEPVNNYLNFTRYLTYGSH